jgi:hypothetical protein
MPAEIKKSQMVRLWDVFGLGPAMIYIGSTGKLKQWEKLLLIGAGIGTIYYNGMNYLKNRENFK